MFFVINLLRASFLIIIFFLEVTLPPLQHSTKLGLPVVEHEDGQQVACAWTGKAMQWPLCYCTHAYGSVLTAGASPAI